jgi:hypothetical protein
MAEISSGLEKRLLAEIESQNRDAAGKLAAEFLAGYSRREYSFCSQAYDANTPPN